MGWDVMNNAKSIIKWGFSSIKFRPTTNSPNEHFLKCVFFLIIPFFNLS